jgi:hypothetical protein
MEQARLLGRTAATSAAFLLPHLQPGWELLDCGCGVGSITCDFAHAVAPGRFALMTVRPNRMLTPDCQLRREGAVIFIAQFLSRGLPRTAFEQAWEWREGAGKELLKDLISTARRSAGTPRTRRGRQPLEACDAAPTRTRFQTRRHHARPRTAASAESWAPRGRSARSGDRAPATRLAYRRRVAPEPSRPLSSTAMCESDHLARKLVSSPATTRSSGVFLTSTFLSSR